MTTIQLYELACKYLEVTTVQRTDSLFEVAESSVAILNFLFHAAQKSGISVEDLLDELSYGNMTLERIGEVVQV